MAPDLYTLTLDKEGMTIHLPNQTAVYKVFRQWEKFYIVSLITLAGWFSTLSSFIYYPAITFVARDLRTTVASVILTITSYMIVSGIARRDYWRPRRPSGAKADIRNGAGDMFLRQHWHCRTGSFRGFVAAEDVAECRNSG